MILVHITFANGDTITTRFAGTEEQARRYYAPGHSLNIGTVDDNIQPITAVEVLGEVRGQSNE